MPAGNNAIQKNHFHKDWDKRVKTWFDQPAKKVSRRRARVRKAISIFPRPVQGLLRPVVHPPTVRYNAKVRLGRGFTLEELKGAAINRKLAQTIGIAVDHRRHNKSEQSLRANVHRLKVYKSKLVLFPRDKKHPRDKKGDSPAEELKKVSQVKGTLLPVHAPAPHLTTVNKSDINPKASAFNALRKARANARLIGVRAKRAKKRKEKAALEAQKKSQTQ
jgi:large subunit ribosomal protein L13e